MSTTPQAIPDPDAARQAAYDSLKAVLAQADTARFNQANTPDARAVAQELYNATNDQIFVLDQAKITQDSLALQASLGQMTPGMKELKDLQKKIEDLGSDIKEATDILCGIDKALCELKTLGPL